MNINLLRICLVCLLFISHIQISTAQWQETNGPFGGYICSVAHDGTNLYAGTNISGLYSSADNGANCSLNYYTSFYFRMNALLVDISLFMQWPSVELIYLQARRAVEYSCLQITVQIGLR